MYGKSGAMVIVMNGFYQPISQIHRVIVEFTLIIIRVN